jgi:hypothetical protein
MAMVMLMTISAYAQKVDLDKFNFTFGYRALPTAPLSPEYRTFSVDVTTTPVVRNNFTEGSLEDAVVIHGWRRVTGAPGHLLVNVQLDDLIITKSDIIERVDVQKDKDGKETGRTYYYKVVVDYTWQGRASVRDYKEAPLDATNLGSNMATTWSSEEYSTRKGASDFYYNNKNEIKGRLLREQVNTGLGYATQWLSGKYGYTPSKEYEVLWILDSKKHPEFQAQKDIWDAYKAAVATVTADDFPAATKDKFNEFIKYFDGIPAKYATDDKGEKKLRYASFYNKAKLYLYLDNPEAAIQEADKLIANAYDEGDGKRIKKEAEALIESFKKNNQTSRHFSIDVSQFQPPAL